MEDRAAEGRGAKSFKEYLAEDFERVHRGHGSGKTRVVSRKDAFKSTADPVGSTL